MKNCKHKLLILLFLLLTFCVQVYAQTPEGARRQMELGNYSNAVRLYSALTVLYPKSYKVELSIAKQCLSLLRSAQNNYKKERYSEAIDDYNKILKINSNDQAVLAEIRKCESARVAYLDKEYANCKTISDYRTFIQLYPGTIQAEMADRIVKEMELKEIDEISWSLEDSGGKGTIESYTRYIKTANAQASHTKDAYRNRARLYCRNMEYGKALSDFNMAKKLGCYLSAEDMTQYVICSAETRYASIVQHPSSVIVADYLGWTGAYDNNDVIAPHLHINEARGLLVREYCMEGWYKLATVIVDQNHPSISTVHIINSDVKWKKKDWQTYIRQSEKNAKRSKGKNAGVVGGHGF